MHSCCIARGNSLKPRIKMARLYKHEKRQNLISCMSKVCSGHLSWQILPLASMAMPALLQCWPAPSAHGMSPCHPQAHHSGRAGFPRCRKNRMAGCCHRISTPRLKADRRARVCIGIARAEALRGAARSAGRGVENAGVASVVGQIVAAACISPAPSCSRYVPIILSASLASPPWRASRALMYAFRRGVVFRAIGGAGWPCVRAWRMPSASIALSSANINGAPV